MTTPQDPTPPALPEPQAPPLPGDGEPADARGELPPASRRSQRALEFRAALLLILMALLIGGLPQAVTRTSSYPMGTGFSLTVSPPWAAP